MLSEIASLVPPQASVLECAAGTGAISIAIAPKAEKILCTDLSLPMLDQAQKKAGKQKITNIAFAERDIFHLLENDESFDVVVAANVIHLLDRPNDALRELWRVTKKNGLLIIPTFLTQGSKAGFAFLIKIYKLLGFNPRQSFSETDYRTMLESCGFPLHDFKILAGRVPVGFGVFKKT